MKTYSRDWITQTLLADLHGVSSIAMGKILVNVGLKDNATNGASETAKRLNMCETYNRKHKETPGYVWSQSKVIDFLEARGIFALPETENDDYLRKKDLKRQKKRKENNAKLEITREERFEVYKKITPATPSQIEYLKRLNQAAGQKYDGPANITMFAIEQKIEECKKYAPCTQKQKELADKWVAGLCVFYPVTKNEPVEHTFRCKKKIIYLDQIQEILWAARWLESVLDNDVLVFDTDEKKSYVHILAEFYDIPLLEEWNEKWNNVSSKERKKRKLIYFPYDTRTWR